MASDPETTAAPTENLTFELKRFAWLTPDRLGVSGTFAGLEPPADDAAVLVIRAGERVFRLPVAGDGRGGQLDESGVWQTAFEWLDAPVAFDAAELELAEGLVVELPGLDGKRRLSRKRLLEVRNLVGGAAVEPAEPGSLGSQVELVAAQEALRGVRVAMQQTEQELERAREDLQTERELRTGDGQRFREELAKLRASAEQALAAEQSGQTMLREQLEAAGARRPRRRRGRRPCASGWPSSSTTVRRPSGCAPSSRRPAAPSTEPEKMPSGSSAA